MGNPKHPSPWSGLTFLLILFLCPPALHPQKILIVTEELPPFNYTVDGRPTGVATELMKEILAQTGLDYEIRFMPWARAYATARSRKNTIIYSIKRTPSREEEFIWLGALLTDQCGVFALKTQDLQPQNLEELKEYTLGTYRDDSTELFLLKQGFTRSHPGTTKAPLISYVGQNPHQEIFQDLLQGKIDFWPNSISYIYYTVRQAGIADPQEIIKMVLPLEELSSQAIHFAAQRESDPRIIGRIINAYRELKKSPRYAEILSKWGLSLIPAKPKEP